jgi:4-diphosphocytidyl-2-C-methyl-D-erythritol kinase
VRARAKVNLGLEVLGRRPDGYHELSTLFVAVDLADRVHVETTAGPEIEVACDAPGVPSGPENLAWRAAAGLRAAAGIDRGVRVRIEKAIPVAAGLGGGSVDAAAVLAALGRLLGLAWPRERWTALATGLGMDVPFFLGDGPAIGSGRGEVLAPVRLDRSLALVVVNPGFPLATRDVYGAVRPAHFTTGEGVRALVRALPGGARAVAGRLINGLEPAVSTLWPGLAEIREALRAAGALGTVMSGSGPTVVGVLPSPAAARRTAGLLAGRPWRTWVTRTVGGPALAFGPRRPAAVAWGVAKR